MNANVYTEIYPRAAEIDAFVCASKPVNTAGNPTEHTNSILLIAKANKIVEINTETVNLSAEIISLILYLVFLCDLIST